MRNSKKRTENKKGALELSMSTIVVIVIGITLLTLGLLFVRTIFKQIQDISDIAFLEAEAQLTNLRPGDEILSIPSEVKVSIGDSQPFDIQIANDGSARPPGESFNIAITPNPDLKNGKISIVVNTKPNINIPEGKKVRIQVIASVDKDSILDPAGFFVTVKYGDEVYQEGGFLISPQPS